MSLVQVVKENFFWRYTTPPMSLNASQMITLSDESFDIDVPLGSLSASKWFAFFTVNPYKTSSYNFTFPNNEELTLLIFPLDY